MAHAQVDCLGVEEGTALPGTPCDDNNPLTFSDTWYPGCVCIGQCEPTGDPCDDGNPLTTNDQMSACGCFGTCFAALGEPCDDGNPFTINDRMWPYGCVCIGDCDQPVGALCDDGDPSTVGEFLVPGCHCVGGTNLISGRVFLDVDGDGGFGGTDVAIPNRLVQAGPGVHYTMTDASGDFDLLVPSGSYQLFAAAGSYDVPSGPPISLSLVGQGLISGGHELPMNVAATLPDLAAHACSGMPVPGFLHYIWAVCRNEGTTAIAGNMALTFDPQLGFISADPSATVVGNVVQWAVPSLAPGEQLSQRVVLLTPTSLPIGTTLAHTVTVTASPPDGLPANDMHTWQEVVRGAYDPNDKQVRPTTLSPDEVAERRPVEYTIRFQNTGTAPAHDVRITDELPHGVDPATFEFLGSSHPCHALFHDGVLEFRFDGIMLPDSGASGPESHGYVQFQVKPYASLLAGDSVSNRANIHFDLNAPITTNAATFRVEATTQAIVRIPERKVLRPWPDPTDGPLTFDLPEGSAGRVHVQVLDPAGRIVFVTDVVANSGRVSLSTAGLADGLYVLNVTHDGPIHTARFIKEH